MKNCSNPTCSQINPQPFENFHKNKTGKNGLKSHCKSCRKIKTRIRYKANKEKILAVNKVWTKANTEKAKSIAKEWREANPEKTKAANKAWVKANPDKKNALVAKRYSIKLQAAPIWLTSEHYKQIDLFYTEATRITKETGIKHHVDHIIPLQGKEVKGLHVPWNLQILTAKENVRKHNKVLI